MEINDFAIRKISLALAILGILAVFAFAALSQPIEVKVKELGESNIGKKVVLNGIVTSAYLRKGSLIFEIFDGKKINGVKFSPTLEEKLAVRKENELRIEGTVQKYNGKLEIIAEKIYSVGKYD